MMTEGGKLRSISHRLLVYFSGGHNPKLPVATVRNRPDVVIECLRNQWRFTLVYEAQLR